MDSDAIEVPSRSIEQSPSPNGPAGYSLPRGDFVWRTPPAELRRSPCRRSGVAMPDPVSVPPGSHDLTAGLVRTAPPATSLRGGDGTSGIEASVSESGRPESPSGMRRTSPGRRSPSRTAGLPGSSFGTGPGRSASPSRPGTTVRRASRCVAPRGDSRRDRHRSRRGDEPDALRRGWPAAHRAPRHRRGQHDPGPRRPGGRPAILLGATQDGDRKILISDPAGETRIFAGMEAGGEPTIEVLESTDD